MHRPLAALAVLALASLALVPAASAAAAGVPATSLASATRAECDLEPVVQFVVCTAETAIAVAGVLVGVVQDAAHLAKCFVFGGPDCP